ncbi:hypothetical protein JOM56_015701 [Amanita muscaria]
MSFNFTDTSAGPYSLHSNTLRSHAYPPFDHQIFTTPYEPQQSLVQNFQTDMDLDSNRQQLHVAMREDVSQQIPEPLFQANSESMPLHSATMVHGIEETAAVYGVGNNDNFTGMYHRQHRPLVNDIFMNNAQPSYYSSNSVGTIHQSPNMAVTERPISADYYLTLALENTNTLTTPTTAYNGGTAQEISESDLAVTNHLMPIGVFMNNVQPSQLMTQQTQSHAHNEQADHPGNLAVGNIQSSALPISANYHLALDEDTNMYYRLSDGGTAYWRCNISGCQYVSRFKRDIKRHCSKLGHGGRREHGCKFCRKAFMRRDVLKRHVTETRCRLRWLGQAQLPLPEGDLREYQV